MATSVFERLRRLEDQLELSANSSDELDRLIADVDQIKNQLPAVTDHLVDLNNVVNNYMKKNDKRSKNIEDRQDQQDHCCNEGRRQIKDLNDDAKRMANQMDSKCRQQTLRSDLIESEVEDLRDYVRDLMDSLANEDAKLRRFDVAIRRLLQCKCECDNGTNQPYIIQRIKGMFVPPREIHLTGIYRKSHSTYKSHGEYLILVRTRLLPKIILSENDPDEPTPGMDWDDHSASSECHDYAAIDVLHYSHTINRQWRQAVNWAVTANVSTLYNGEKRIIKFSAGAANQRSAQVTYTDYSVSVSFNTVVLSIWNLCKEGIQQFTFSCIDAAVEFLKLLQPNAKLTINYYDYTDDSSVDPYNPGSWLFKTFTELVKFVPRFRFTYYKPEGSGDLEDRSGGVSFEGVNYEDNNDTYTPPTNDEYWKTKGGYFQEPYSAVNGVSSPNWGDDYIEKDHKYPIQTELQQWYVISQQYGMRYGPYKTQQEADDVRNDLIDQYSDSSYYSNLSAFLQVVKL